MKSLAAVFHSNDKPLTLETFLVPEPAAGEVIVRIRCATICGSDLHSIAGRRSCPTPSVLGHEMVGEVAALHIAGATDFHGCSLTIGDRVTWSMLWSCGECRFCKLGLTPKCERLYKYGHEALTPGCELTGAYAEYCLLRPGTAICKVPENVPDTVAAPSNCATATVAAVLRTAGSVSGLKVVVLGAGMLGLTACAMSHYEGAAQVVCIEKDLRRRALAHQFGATSTSEADADGADIVLEFAGTPEACEAALQMVRIGGKVMLAGTVSPTRAIEVSPEMVVRRMLMIAGVHNYVPADLDHALQFLAGTQIDYPFAQLTGASFPLAEINQAIAFAEAHRPPRVAVIP